MGRQRSIITAEEVAEQYQTLRKGGTSPREAWLQLKGWFTQRYNKSEGDEKQEKNIDQAWKSTSGKALELIVEDEFRRCLKEHSLKGKGDTHQFDEGDQGEMVVCRWKDVKDEMLRRILSEPLWIRGELREPYLAESQVDFVAIEQRDGKLFRVISVYSCKASSRERFQQDLYWVGKFRERGIRFCYVTMDSDGNLFKAASTGEVEKKEVGMALALYDRIYLFVEDTDINHHKEVLRPVSALLEDIQLWRRAG